MFSRGLGNIDHNEFTFLKKIRKFMALKENGEIKMLYKHLHEYTNKYIKDEVKKSDRYNILKKDNIFKDDPMDDTNYEFLLGAIDSLL